MNKSTYIRTLDRYNLSREEIEKAFKELENDYTGLCLEADLDYGGCYYEGDTPSVDIELWGIKK